MIIIKIFFLIIISLFSQENEYYDNSNIIFEKKKNENILYFKYSLDLNFKNFNKIYLLPISIYKSTERMTLEKSFNVKFYGYKISPFKIIKIKKNNENIIISTGTEKKEIKKQNKEIIINLSALYDDFYNNTNNFILENSFKPLTPQWEHLNKKEKKDFFKDLSYLSIWDNFILKDIGIKVKEISK